MSKAPRDFWVKATGYQNEACTSPNKGIDLTLPGEDRWIYTTIQTVHPGTNSVAMKTKWLHVREVLPSEPDLTTELAKYRALAEEMAEALPRLYAELELLEKTT